MVTGLIISVVMLIGFTAFGLLRTKRPNDTYEPYDEIRYSTTEQAEETRHVRGRGE
ncbi:hypothetical protein MUG87_02740 [Ectobacillus sp. JY-23]|uniref:hypothetical protein n=1 Tax=Ectobacillus sp. JY-23 TaxID=2933872 RepID=UPI001FF5F4C2|nr:hypothetical protein [Ectobacillus sp. JY-23]UOY93071.1 hypothetical protein MUG87_02740 [Ectobacillus sp. JY-23]